MSKERTFRPAWPPLREWLSPAFFALIVAGLLYATVRDGDPKWLAPAGGSALLMAAGLYLGLRNRWPGRPTLIMDHERLVYSRFGRERALRWDEVERIGDGRYLAQEMMFVPVSGGKPIVVSSQMVTADGEYFLGLIEEYWTPPKKRRKRSR